MLGFKKKGFSIFFHTDVTLILKDIFLLIKLVEHYRKVKLLKDSQKNYW